MSEKKRAGMTPGPWEALSGGPYVVKSNSDPNGSCGNSVICITANTASHVRFAAEVGSLEDKANAKAIAALPELLEALRDIVGMAAIWQLDLDKSPNTMNVAFESARKALAKAGVGGAE